MRRKQIAGQTGFTLVEISIVLVIIGLLLGGALKGQELINSAKVKNLAQDFRTVPVLINAYQDKFRALPGDDGRAASHVCPTSTPACTTGGDANGSIGGHWDDAAATASESVLFWQHVRLANLAAGATNLADANFLPFNSEGGRLGIQAGGESAPFDVPGSQVICSAAIPGKFIRQLDSILDDGDPETGNLRAGMDSSNSAVTTATLDDSTPYVACLGV
ncbi:MAG: prepilin-type N-terminal cleavage/methylation domain-containing protein [Azoarcus sp.]|jgi:prepilin-type N-terminal cleavage/methylation domain-containing protein|nr:prepilin-type N-terminal cleavage/methylation domain-containing protein [Azoarcus sp.]